MSETTYVFPYVNPTDSNWISSYEDFTGKPFVPNLRFDEFNLLKYLLRGIYFNASWVDNVVMIVSNKSQVPDWVNSDKITIVEHGDFIPKHFLPTFNSNTIEMFLPFIDGLGRNIIYGNDDTIIVRKLEKEDFFDSNDVPKISYVDEAPIKCGKFARLVERCSSLIEPGSYIKQAHQNAAWNKITLRNVYVNYQKEILGSITPFRDLDRNLSQYIFTDYQILKGKHIKVPNNGLYVDIFDKNTLAELENEGIKQVCFNNNGFFSEDDFKSILGFLDRMLPNKSAYEN